MTKKTKLELTWPGKDERPRLEPRILIEDPAKSYHAATRRGVQDQFDNMLIKGDNLLALKALEADYAGKVKCIYIDPPFNTQNDFFYYEDGMEHSRWLSLMSQRFSILHSLLESSGVLFVHLDHNEAAYCKIVLDEIFGRQNFLNTVTTKTNDASGFKATGQSIFSTANQIHVYAKDRVQCRLNRVYLEKGYDTGYSMLIENPEDSPLNWTFCSVQQRVAREGGYADAKTARKALGGNFEIQVAQYAVENAASVFQGVAISGGAAQKRAATIQKSKNQLGRVFIHQGDEGTGFYILNGRQIVLYRDRLKDIDGKLVPSELLTDVWTDISWNGIGNEGQVEFKNGKKPEALVQRVLKIATERGDLVLDSFAGSGTTGAVAHKMGRRWIMVEIGEHADTHIVPRLQKVIDGTDAGGVTKATGWQGGGGFRYYTLAPSLLREDNYGNWVIAKDYNPEMLAKALCKHLGFTYAPSTDIWWQHGRSTETDFLYVTTQSLTADAVARLADDVGPERSLLVACKAYEGKADAHDNLTLVKIPSAILKRCEWGRDDYSLNIAALPDAPAPERTDLFDGEEA
jgi:adenine-specific DNA-methyltransferase